MSLENDNIIKYVECVESDNDDNSIKNIKCIEYIESYAQSLVENNSDNKDVKHNGNDKNEKDKNGKDKNEIQRSTLKISDSKLLDQEINFELHSKSSLLSPELCSTLGISDSKLLPKNNLQSMGKSIISPRDSKSILVTNTINHESKELEEYNVATVCYDHGPYYLIKLVPANFQRYQMTDLASPTVVLEHGGLQGIIPCVEHRVMVILVEPNVVDTHESLNRCYSLWQKQGLAHVLILLSHIYETQLGIKTRIETTSLNKESEPAMLYGCVIIRDDYKDKINYKSMNSDVELKFVNNLRENLVRLIESYDIEDSCNITMNYG